MQKHALVHTTGVCQGLGVYELFCGTGTQVFGPLQAHLSVVRIQSASSLRNEAWFALNP